MCTCESMCLNQQYIYIVPLLIGQQACSVWSGRLALCCHTHIYMCIYSIYIHVWQQKGSLPDQIEQAHCPMSTGTTKSCWLPWVYSVSSRLVIHHMKSRIDPWVIGIISWLATNAYNANLFHSCLDTKDQLWNLTLNPSGNFKVTCRLSYSKIPQADKDNRKRRRRRRRI